MQASLIDVNHMYNDFPLLSAATLSDADLSDVLDVLHSTPLCGDGDLCRYRIEEVSINDVQPLCINVIQGRLKKAFALLEAYHKANMQPYLPMLLHHKEFTHLVAPPVIWENAKHLVLLDGTHRLYAARASGISKIKALVVNGMVPALPGDPVDWKRLAEVCGPVPIHQRFENYRYTKADILYTDIFNSSRVRRKRSRSAEAPYV